MKSSQIFAYTHEMFEILSGFIVAATGRGLLELENDACLETLTTAAMEGRLPMLACRIPKV